MRGTRKALATAVAVLGIAVAPGAAQAAETWTQVGGTISAAPVEAGQYDMKRIAGAPYVAWTDTSGAADVVRVARLNSAGAWVAVGGPVNTDPAANASGPSLVAGPGDVPWISWLEDDDGLNRVRVARYDAAAGKWVEVAPNSLINRITTDDADPWLSSARQAKLVFVGGRAHVVFRQENPSAYEVGHVRLSADGNSWERLASPPKGDEPYFVTAHVSGGSLYAATRGLLGGVEVYRYTSAGTWEQLGGLANPAPEGEPLPTSETALASFGGVIHVLHSVPDRANGVYVTRFVNGTWQIVGDIFGEGPVSSLRVIGGRLYAGWSNASAARVSRLDAAGTAWGSTAHLPVGSRAPILTGVGGVPYAAIRGADLRLEVYRLDGTTPGGPDDNDDSEPPAQPACGKERVGTKSGDRLTGTSARETIRGLGGNDRILGLGGADCLFGDAGDDRVEGGDGNDELDGGTGNDRLISGAGYDTVRGGSGDDVIDSRGKGWDTIDCGPGNDRALVGDLDRVRNCERVQNVD